MHLLMGVICADHCSTGSGFQRSHAHAGVLAAALLEVAIKSINSGQHRAGPQLDGCITGTETAPAPFPTKHQRKPSLKQLTVAAIPVAIAAPL